MVPDFPRHSLPISDGADPRFPFPLSPPFSPLSRRPPRRRLAPLSAQLVNGNSVDLRSRRLNPGEVRFVELDVLFDLFGDRDFAADFVRTDALPIFQR
jgi:hypothetical protein